ncbi:hypothetical protein ACLB2K_026770 [Fragaria x ananassa]
MADLQQLKEPIINQTNVALQISKQLLETEFHGKNMIYSPQSIHIVLSLIAARNNFPQLLSFLNSKSIAELNSLVGDLVASVLVDSPTRGWPRLNFTNGVWVDESEPLDESYKKVVLDSYKAALNHVDFKTNPEQVRSQVNAWVKKETKGLIPQILPPGSIKTETSLICANALYFKATWSKPHFTEPKTKEHEFHLMNGDSVMKVPFMTSNDCHYIGAFDGFKVLRLFSGSMRMVSYLRTCLICLVLATVNTTTTGSSLFFWLLPDARDGLPALVERVCTESGFLDRYTDLRYVRVREFLIPKFKMSSRFEASGVLKKMGLGDVLDLMEIVHESVIEVDENGTTAAAATYAVIRTCSAGKASEPDEKLDFVADHPFMFLIRPGRHDGNSALHGAGPQSSCGLITIILLEDVLCKQVNFLGFHYVSYFCNLDYSSSLVIVLS